MSEEKKKPEPAKAELVEKKANLPSTEMQMSREDLEQMYGTMEQDDVIIPRIVVLQGLSPEVSAGNGRPGEFYVKGLDQNLGKGPLEIIVLLRNKSRIRWRDLKMGGGQVCRSADAVLGFGDPGGECKACPYAQWSTGEDGRPGCDLYQNVVVVLRKETEWVPLALSGNRTKLKALKALNTLLMLELMKQRPMFGKSYMVESVQKSNSQGMAYHTLKFSPGNENKVLPEEDMQKAFAMYQGLKGRKIEIAQDSGDEEEGKPDTNHKEF